MRVDAAPSAFAFDPQHAAVIVVDMQNDFGSAGGMFARAGIDIAPIRAVVPALSRVLAAARRAHIPIVYLKMAYQPDLSDLGAVGSPNRERHLALGVGNAVTAPNGEANRVLIRDTWSTRIVDELKPEPGDIELYKTRFSGFYETELDATLRRRAVRSLIVTGCTTSICVDSTIRDAAFRDYSCLVLRDCCAEAIGNDLVRTNHEASLLATQVLLGWVSDSAALARALESA